LYNKWLVAERLNVNFQPLNWKQPFKTVAVNQLKRISKVPYVTNESCDNRN